MRAQETTQDSVERKPNLEQLLAIFEKLIEPGPPVQNEWDTKRYEPSVVSLSIAWEIALLISGWTDFDPNGTITGTGWGYKGVKLTFSNDTFKRRVVTRIDGEANTAVYEAEKDGNAEWEYTEFKPDKWMKNRTSWGAEKSALYLLGEPNPEDYYGGQLDEKLKRRLDKHQNKG